ncbi:TPA: hypothetical protein TT567_001267 [Streptococcus equi subsp. zooepidemicus]|nr:hypothetical protein [Streptococcus equi subsp. zooepidemicus]
MPDPPNPDWLCPLRLLPQSEPDLALALLGDAWHWSQGDELLPDKRSQANY